MAKTHHLNPLDINHILFQIPCYLIISLSIRNWWRSGYDTCSIRCILSHNMWMYVIYVRMCFKAQTSPCARRFLAIWPRWAVSYWCIPCSALPHRRGSTMSLAVCLMAGFQGFSTPISRLLNSVRVHQIDLAEYYIYILYYYIFFIL